MDRETCAAAANVHSVAGILVGHTPGSHGRTRDRPAREGGPWPANNLEQAIERGAAGISLAAMPAYIHIRGETVVFVQVRDYAGNFAEANDPAPGIAHNHPVGLENGDEVKVDDGRNRAIDHSLEKVLSEILDDHTVETLADDLSATEVDRDPSHILVVGSDTADKWTDDRSGSCLSAKSLPEVD